MTKTAPAPKRKNYSVHPDRARDLAKASIDMTEKTGKTVGRQDILDACIAVALSDKKTYAKVLKAVG